MGESATYWQAFLNKDIRRCEFELYKFFEGFCRNNLRAVVETQYSLGEPVMMLPSTRARLCQCQKDFDIHLPWLDVHLEELYKLTMPLDRGYNPRTLADLKARKVLREHSKYNTLTEEEAKAVFKELKRKYPKLAEIEFIPLPSLENDQYENWHTKLLRQIRVWNVLTEKVAKAKATIIQINTYKAEAAKSEDAPAAKTEISKEEYKGNSVEFLRETDIKGRVANKLLKDIRKRCKDDAKDCSIEGEAGIKKARTW